MFNMNFNGQDSRYEFVDLEKSKFKYASRCSEDSDDSESAQSNLLKVRRTEITREG